MCEITSDNTPNVVINAELELLCADVDLSGIKEVNTWKGQALHHGVINRHMYINDACVHRHCLSLKQERANKPDIIINI